MSRLTYSRPTGEWGLKNYEIKDMPKELYGALYKLKKYEDLGDLTELEDKLNRFDDLYIIKCQEVRDLQELLHEMEELLVEYRQKEADRANKPIDLIPIRREVQHE